MNREQMGQGWLRLDQYTALPSRARPVLLYLHPKLEDEGKETPNKLREVLTDDELCRNLDDYCVRVWTEVDHYPVLMELIAMLADRIKRHGHSPWNVVWLTPDFAPLAWLDLGEDREDMRMVRQSIVQQAMWIGGRHGSVDDQRDRRAFERLGQAITTWLGETAQDSSARLEDRHSLAVATRAAVLAIDPDGIGLLDTYYKSEKREAVPHLLRVRLAWDSEGHPASLTPNLIRRNQQIVAGQVEGLLSTGLFDAVWGGLYSLSSARDWNSPVPVKSLEVNAAFLELLLDLRGKCQWRRYDPVINHVLHFLTQHMYDPHECLFHGALGEANARTQQTHHGVEDLQGILDPRERELLEQCTNLSDWRGEFRHDKRLRFSHDTDRVLDRYDDIVASLQRAYGRFRTDEAWVKSSFSLAGSAQMAAVLMRAARLLNSSSHFHLADQVISRLWDHFQRNDGDLPQCIGAGQAGGCAMLNVYSFLANALLVKYRYTLDLADLNKALQVHAFAEAHFWDRDKGCFHLCRTMQRLTGHRIYRSQIAAVGSAAAALKSLVQIRTLTGCDYDEAIGSSYRKLYYLMQVCGMYPEGSTLLEAFNWVRLEDVLIVSFYCNGDHTRTILSELAFDLSLRLRLSVLAIDNKRDENTAARVLAQIDAPRKGTLYVMQKRLTLAEFQQIDELKEFLMGLLQNKQEKSERASTLPA